MTTRLYFISLAATPALRKGYFPDDEALDARGREETLAAGLWQHLPAGARWLISPAQLAQDTAALWQKPAQPEPALADMDYGNWRGKALAAVGDADPAALGAWLQQPDAPASAGESFAQVFQRVGTWLDTLDGGDVVALTHAPVIRAAILFALQAPVASFNRIEIPPLTCFELRRAGNGWRWWPSSQGL